MKNLTDNASHAIGAIFRTFFGDYHSVTIKGAEPNERHIGALADLTRPESVSAAARIEADCRKALAGIDTELSKLTTELEGTQAALRRTEAALPLRAADPLEGVDDDTFVGILVGAGVPEVYARFLASIFHPVREGWTAVVTDDVRTLTGHPARQVAAWVKENAAILKG